MLRYFLGAVLLAALSASAMAQNTSAQNTAQVSVTVDTARPGPVIDRHIYGQFAEDLGTGIYGGIWVGENSKIPNIHGYRTDVVQAEARQNGLRYDSRYESLEQRDHEIATSANFRKWLYDYDVEKDIVAAAEIA